MFRPVVAILVSVAFAVTLMPAVNSEQCNSPNGCDFWDDQYHEFVLENWDTTSLDVIIIPPASPFATRDIATLEKSVDMWAAAIQSDANSWLSGALTIQRYTLGIDVPPEEALLDPEIVILSAEYNPVLLFGIGTMAPVSICRASTDTAANHQHPGSDWLVQNAECEDGGMQCQVINTNFLLGGQRRMFDLNSHEFGHCLGVGHVGDALDFNAKTFPEADIMSYQYNPDQVHCVSNLNLRTLEGTFAQMLGQPQSLWLSFGDYYHMDPSQYSQVSCQNP